jgi:hypothetical protein
MQCLSKLCIKCILSNKHTYKKGKSSPQGDITEHKQNLPLAGVTFRYIKLISSLTAVSLRLLSLLSLIPYNNVSLSPPTMFHNSPQEPRQSSCSLWGVSLFPNTDQFKYNGLHVRAQQLSFHTRVRMRAHTCTYTHTHTQTTHTCFSFTIILPDLVD